MNIIELAKEAGLPSLTEYGKDCLERFADLVVAHEREECACTCEAYALESMEAFNRTGHDFEDGQVNGGYGCAAAIRARGEK